jgi:foldase protein PrsA
VTAGSLALLVAAGIGLQFFRAHPAASQTTDEAGTATLGSSREGTASKVLAKVNGQAISYDVVARECVSRHGQAVLDNMINRLIIQQECEKRGISVTMAEVEEEVASTAKKFNLPLETWYKMLESERHLTQQQYHEDVIWPMLALKKLAGQKVEVSEEDMKVGFERDYGPRVKARLILVEGNLRQANQIWEKCQANPDDFDRVAREFSADPNTRPLGGVIPPIRRHGGSKTVEDQAFRMKIGEVSPVIQIAESRYVILKCEGFTEPVVTDIREVWDDLYKQLTDEKTQTAVAKIFEDIKQQARIDNHLTNRTSGGRAIQPASAVRETDGPSAVQQASGTRAPTAR